MVYAQRKTFERVSISEFLFIAFISCVSHLAATNTLAWALFDLGMTAPSALFTTLAIVTVGMPIVGRYWFAPVEMSHLHQEPIFKAWLAGHAAFLFVLAGLSLLA